MPASPREWKQWVAMSALSDDVPVLRTTSLRYTFCEAGFEKETCQYTTGGQDRE